MDEQNKCFIVFYRFIDTIDIPLIGFTLLIDISILIFIDLLLPANWQQKTTLHVFVVVLHDQNVKLSRQPFYGKTMSYVLTKDFVACVIAQSIPSLPVPPGHLSFCFGKAASAPGGAGRSYKNPTVGLENETKRKAKKREALHTNCPQPVVNNITAKKITSGHLININDRTINQNFNTTFHIFEDL